MHLEEFIERTEKIFGASFKYAIDLPNEKFTIHTSEDDHVFTIHLRYVATADEAWVQKIEERLKTIFKELS